MGRRKRDTRPFPTIDELFDACPDSGISVGDDMSFDWDETDPSQVALVSSVEGAQRAERLYQEGRRTLAYHRARAAWLKWFDEAQGRTVPTVKADAPGTGKVIPVRSDVEDR